MSNLVKIGTVTAPAGTHQMIAVLVDMIAKEQRPDALRMLRVALRDAASKCSVDEHGIQAKWS